MGTNKTDDYSMAVRFGEDGLDFQVKDESFAAYFEGMEDEALNRILWRKMNLRLPCRDSG